LYISFQHFYPILCLTTKSFKMWLCRLVIDDVAQQTFCEGTRFL